MAAERVVIPSGLTTTLATTTTATWPCTRITMTSGKTQFKLSFFLYGVYVLSSSPTRKHLQFLKWHCSNNIVVTETGGVNYKHIIIKLLELSHDTVFLSHAS